MNQLTVIATFQDKVALADWFAGKFGGEWESVLEEAILNYHLAEGEGEAGEVSLWGLWGYISPDKDPEVEEADVAGIEITISYKLDVSRAGDGTPVIYVKHLGFDFYSPYDEDEIQRELDKERREELEVDKYIEQSYIDDNMSN